MAHDAIDSGDLLLKLNDLLHELLADLLVLDALDDTLVLIHLIINLLDHLVDGHASFLTLLLKGLDVIKNTLF